MDAFLNGFRPGGPETYYVFIGLLRVAAPVLLLLPLRCAKPLLTSGGAGNLGMAVSARRPEAAPDPLGKRGGPQQAQRCGG